MHVMAHFVCFFFKGFLYQKEYETGYWVDRCCVIYEATVLSAQNAQMGGGGGFVLFIMLCKIKKSKMIQMMEIVSRQKKKKRNLFLPHPYRVPPRS